MSEYIKKSEVDRHLDVLVYYNELLIRDPDEEQWKPYAKVAKQTCELIKEYIDELPRRRRICTM